MKNLIGAIRSAEIAQANAVSTIALAEHKIAEIIANQKGIENPSHLAISWYHECPNSPTEYCVYNHHEDPCCDICIYCGDPLERK